MDDASKKLIKLFKIISKKGFIKSSSTSIGAVGNTFEKEIGKKPDSEYLPDFNEIEIKCTTRFSKYPLHLFSVAFDSNENETTRLALKFGHYDKDYQDKKVLFKHVYNTFIGRCKYNFVFEVDRDEEKIYLAVYDSKGNLLEKEAYINFETIKKHILTKLQKLAYIKASFKKENDGEYFRYYSIELYKLKSFDTFLELIEKNLLNIEIVARISKSGPRVGQYRNKNITFSILKENIPLLFDCYYEYNHDDYYR